jgi:calcineurin-like phosphoesterase family protein
MIKTIRVKHPKEDIWFVSDFHYNHDREFIYKARGFNNVIEHDNTIVERWNYFLNEASIVFHLGDLIFGDSDASKLKDLFRRLKFQTLYLLWGNHTAGQKFLYNQTLAAQFPDAIESNGVGHNYEVYPLTYLLDSNPNKKIVFLPQYVDADIDGKKFVLCHYPIISHDKQGHGSYHLCGHSHAGCEFTNKDVGSGFRLDVGIESFGRPINAVEVQEFFNSRSITTFDYHGKVKAVKQKT